MAVGLLQVEVPLQVDAVVLLQRVVGDLQVPLQLQPLFGDLIMDFLIIVYSLFLSIIYFHQLFISFALFFFVIATLPAG